MRHGAVFGSAAKHNMQQHCLQSASFCILAVLGDKKGRACVRRKLSSECLCTIASAPLSDTSVFTVQMYMAYMQCCHSSSCKRNSNESTYTKKRNAHKITAAAWAVATCRHSVLTRVSHLQRAGKNAHVAWVHCCALALFKPERGCPYWGR